MVVEYFGYPTVVSAFAKFKIIVPVIPYGTKPVALYVQASF
jgi:hypothetical protein